MPGPGQYINNLPDGKAARQSPPAHLTHRYEILFFGMKISPELKSQTGSHSLGSVLARANIMQISPTMQT